MAGKKRAGRDLVPEHIHTLLAFDPGAHGAYVVMRREDSWWPEVYDLPMRTVYISKKPRPRLNPTDLFLALGEAVPAKGRRGVMTAVEVQNPRPFDSKVGVATLMYNYATLAAVLELGGLQFSEIQPAKWKMEMGLAGSDKKASISAARKKWAGHELLASDRITADRAEATLLGWWWLYRGLTGV